MPELLDIIGQDAALAQLQRAVAGTRRPHAYIFAGSEGVGRRTTATEFARLLLCESPVSRDNAGHLAELPAGFKLHSACGRCSSCRTVSAGTNADFHLVYKELARFHDDSAVRDRKMQALSIEVVRDFLLDPAYRGSAGGRGRIFLVLQAELMSVPAQNALLKTLEEPPDGVTIILIASSAGDLLATTRSRCQLIRFGPLPLDFVAGGLAEGGTAPTEATFWAALTGGSIGQAQRFAAEKLYDFKRQLVAALAAQGAEPGQLAELLTKTMDRQAKKLQRADDALAASLANRQAGATVLCLLGSAYRDALGVACGSPRPLIHADQADAIARIAARLGPTGTAEVLSQLARYETLLWRNVNTKLLWDNVELTCASAAALEV